MVQSALTTHAFDTSQKSSRDGVRVDRFIDHHAVSTDWRAVLRLMQGAKEVSANYIIGNAGEIIKVVGEEFRAWTSGSAAWDGRAITVDVCNETLAPGYNISAAAQESLAKLKADVSERYGFDLIRAGQSSTVIGHRELYQWFGASYATACPGGLPIDAVTARANFIKTHKTPIPEEENEMAEVTYVAFNQSANGFVPKGWAFVQDGPNGALRPINNLEGSVRLSDGLKSVTFSLYGDDIATLIRNVGVMEWEPLAPGQTFAPATTNGPRRPVVGPGRLTGRIIYGKA